MATVTEKKLAYLQGTKDAIKAALIEKGQAVSNTDTFRSYAEKVKAIPTGIDITLVDNVPIALDFSDGNQFVDAGEGYAVKSAIIMKPDTLIPENIAAGVTIAGIVGTHEGGGGSSADVRYVTFTNAATGETFVKPVAVGDDCVDVVAKGLWATPTQASTAQYDYAFANSWSAEPNGSADANILKNITEDKTVYAVFTATVRYYTITYYDSDGTTVLKTESLAYGTTPSYEGYKEGFIFNGWQPELAMVTGDASYIGQFAEGYSFAESAWADIARISEAGEASKYFKVGDTRYQDMGTAIASRTVKLMILGFDHDDLADGTGKAGMTIGMYYTGDVLKTAANLRKNYTSDNLPSDLKAVVKSVKKYGYENGYARNANKTLWLFTYTELGGDPGDTYRTADSYNCTAYEAATQGLFPRKTYQPNGSTITNYPLRVMPVNTAQQLYVADKGQLYNGGVNDERYARFGFCV